MLYESEEQRLQKVRRVFGKMVKLAAPVLDYHHSDLHVDAITLLQLDAVGKWKEFVWGFSKNGTYFLPVGNNCKFQTVAQVKRMIKEERLNEKHFQWFEGNIDGLTMLEI